MVQGSVHFQFFEALIGMFYDHFIVTVSTKNHKNTVGDKTYSFLISYSAQFHINFMNIKQENQFHFKDNKSIVFKIMKTLLQVRYNNKILQNRNNTFKQQQSQSLCPYWK